MRYSQYLIPTMREEPSEAEVVSHKLMLRAGMIRKLAAGIYSLLPLGQIVVQKTAQIIREEMNRAGAIEVMLPVVQPAELWHESGRWDIYGKELLRFKDRSQREFCLGPTHEEVITDMVRGVVSSYRQLPLNLYQINIKFRDEIRPRFGVMRAREFIMKDAYSFDADEKSAEISYQKMHDAYSRIFTRIGLNFKPVEADTGPIGGSFSHEFMVLAETGEDTIVICKSCGYAANMEKAEIAAPVNIEFNKAEFNEMKRVDTPGKRTVEEVTCFLNVNPENLIKTLIFSTSAGPVAALVRGDHDVNEIKLKNHLGCDTVELADDKTIEKVTNAPRGFAGPCSIKGAKIIADFGLAAGTNFVTGGNCEDIHLINVNFERDFEASEFADIRFAGPGDLCAKCGKELSTNRGIEVGHIFKLGRKYSASMNAVCLDSKGSEVQMVMGCYGIGVGRTVAAAIEQSHDNNGIIFPPSIAPFLVSLVPVNTNDQKQMEISNQLYCELMDNNIEVLYDDRDERPGSKFKDADLTGIPYRVTVGRNATEKNMVDLKFRSTGEVENISVDRIVDRIKQVVEGKL